MNRKTSAALVAVLMVAAALVGLSSPSASAALVCGDNRVDTATTGNVRDPAGDVMRFSTRLTYQRCHNGTTQSAYVHHLRVDDDMIDESGNCPGSLDVLNDPEDFDGINLGTATWNSPCTSAYNNYWAYWTFGGDGTMVYKSNSYDQKCVKVNVKWRTQFGVLESWWIPNVCVTFN